MIGEPRDATADELDISVATPWGRTPNGRGVAQLAVGRFRPQQRRLDPVRDLFGARLRFSDQRLEQSSPQMLRDW